MCLFIHPLQGTMFTRITDTFFSLRNRPKERSAAVTYVKNFACAIDNMPSFILVLLYSCHWILHKFLNYHLNNMTTPDNVSFVCMKPGRRAGCFEALNSNTLRDNVLSCSSPLTDKVKESDLRLVLMTGWKINHALQVLLPWLTASLLLSPSPHLLPSSPRAISSHITAWAHIPPHSCIAICDCIACNLHLRKLGWHNCVRKNNVDRHYQYTGHVL